MNDSPDEPADRDEARELAEDGVELAGALVGAGIGLVAGPIGAVAGAGLGIVAKRAAKIVMRRFEDRERARAGAALLLIQADTREREARGDAPRQDGFFDETGELRSDAEELLEGVLRQAASSYEERKVPLLARLYSSAAHDPLTGGEDALYMVRLAGELTYRQFVALSVLANHEQHFEELARAHGLREEGRSEQDHALLLELDDLGDRRLIGLHLGGGRVGAIGEVIDSSGPASSLRHGGLRLTDAGEQFVRLTGADELPAADRENWVRSLRGWVHD